MAVLLVVGSMSAYAAITVITDTVGVDGDKTVTLGVDSTVSVDFNITETGVTSADFMLQYDPAVLRLTNVVFDKMSGFVFLTNTNFGVAPANAGPYTGSTANGVLLAQEIGKVLFSGSFLASGDPSTENGKLFTATFSVFGAGTSTVSLVQAGVLDMFVDENGANMNITINSGSVTVAVTDAGAVSSDKASLTLGDTSAIIANMTLPTSGANGTTISWASANSAVATNGTVTRPTFTAGNVTGNLTATITKGASTDTKIFAVTVLAMPINDIESVAAAKAALTLGDTSAVTASNITLPTTGASGTTISWSSDAPGVVNNTGSVTIPDFGAPAGTATLTATIMKGVATDTETFNVTVPAALPTNAEAVAAAKAVLTILGDLNNVTSNLTLSAVGLHSTTVSWSSDTPGVIANNGTVTRPSFSSGDAAVVLTATISRAGSSDTKVFNATVLKLGATDADAVAGAKAALSIAGDMDSVKTNLTLASTGLDGTTITWSSNNTSAVSNAGVVTRPAFSGSHASVTLTATITKGAASDTREFPMTVLKKQDGVLTFSIGVLSGTINNTAKTITLTSPTFVDVSNVAAMFTLPAGTSATVGVTPQMSGMSLNNFTTPVTYIITDVDGNTSNYTVSVTVAKQFTITGTKTATGNRTNVNLTITNAGANRNATIIVALYESSGATDMKAFVYKPQSSLGASTSFDAGFLVPSGTYVIKAFVWDADGFTAQTAVSEVFIP